MPDDRLGALVRERGPSLVGYAYLLTGELHDAQDLVQEALVHTFSRRRSGANIQWLEAYVRQAILNVFLDGYRKHRRLRGRIHLMADQPARFGQPDAVAACRLDVHAALAVLPARERACVVLRYYGDLSVRELAERLNLTEGTVKRYLSNARQRLGPLLGEADVEHVEVVETEGRGR